MSGFCPNDADLYTGITRPHGNGGMFENGRTDANPILEGREWLNKQVRETANQAEWAKSVSRSIDIDTIPGQPLNGGERQQVSSGARQLAELYDRALSSVGKRIIELEEAIRKISGSTVSEASKWLDFTNTVSRLFAWKDAVFNRFALTNFGMEGRSILDNRLVSAFQSVEPVTQGQYQKYLNITENYARKWDAVAKRLGFDTKDLLEAAGYYANGQHAPEVNTLLLQRWSAEISAERAKPADKRVQKYITDREGWIADLRENLNELDPIDAEGNPRTIKSSGYTNAQAAKMMDDILRETGATKAEMEGMAQDIRNLYRQIMQDRVDAGLVSPDLIARFPEFEYFVPLKTKYDNTTGAVNNTHIYNPGSYYAIDGSTGIPDSSWLSVMHFARRVSNEIGMQRFGTELAAAKMVAEQQGRGIAGLEMRDYGQLMAFKNGNDPYMRDWATNVDSRGGIIVDVPARDADGNDSGTKRMVLNFDPTWTDPISGATGVQLNDAINGKTKVSASTSILTTPTSLYGQMFTRFNPAFAPVNTGRDLFERGINMAARDYYSQDGSLVRGSSLVGKYFLNAPRAGKFLYDALQGKLDPSSPGAQYWREYVENGLHQQYTRGQNNPRRSLADLINEQSAPKGWVDKTIQKMPGLGQRLAKLSVQQGQQVKRALDGWNDYFNNAAIFNHYITLREAGLSTRNASQGVIEMLNLYQGGQLQPALSMLFPFVKPTAQSGVALARTLGLSPNAAGKFEPNIRGLTSIIGATAAYTMLMPLMKESLGQDPETGMNRYDQLGLSELQRFIPIGMGDDGDYFKLPTGFGPTQLATTLAVGADRVARGLMRPEDFLFETLYVVGKNVSPGDWPEFSMRTQPMEWFQYAFSPSILKPLLTNIDFRGRPITNARVDGFTARADQGRTGTEKIYHQMAKGLQQSTGFDMAPEQIKNWVKHISVGPFRLISGMLNQDELRTRGQRTTSYDEMGPWLSAMGGSLLYGRTYDTGRSMYYQALDNYRERIRREGIDIKDRSYGNDPEKREIYQTRVLKRAGWSTDDINDFLILMDTETKLRSNNQKFSNEVRPIWLSSDESSSIRRVFEELAVDQGNLYNTAVNQLSFYTGAR